MENSEIFVGLDLGTTKIDIIVGRRNEHGKIEILGYGKSESIGIMRGVVVLVVVAGSFRRRRQKTFRPLEARTRRGFIALNAATPSLGVTFAEHSVCRNLVVIRIAHVIGAVHECAAHRFGYQMN